MTVHKNLADSELHENKGVASAATSSVATADGSGNTVWQKLTESNINLTNTESPNTVYLTGVLADVSTASSILVPCLDNMTLVSAVLILGGAITVANSAVSFLRNGADSMGSSVTVAYSGSAEGTAFTFTPTGNTLVSANGYVKISTDGGSTTTAPLYVALKFKRSF